MYIVLLNSYYLITVFFCFLFYCPYMLINVNVHCNGGFLPENILLTLLYVTTLIGEPF